MSSFLAKPSPITADEWDRSLAPRVMFPHVRDTAHPRKLRLFACAICRALWDRITNEDCRRGVEVAEAVADGEATEASRASAQSKVNATLDESGQRDLLRLGVSHALTKRKADASFAAEVVSHNSLCVVKGPKLRRTQAELIRCIFGNPFRSAPAFDAAWRTAAVVSLAQQMYESRDFGEMPILGDALEDAGCDNDGVLSHCRGSGPHARGCWVVDLVLGKT
jgi:hypothetical protein